MASATAFGQNSKLHYILLTFIALLFYANSINNEYALDDGLVITENPYTRQGLSGIADIFSHDAYQWYYEEKGSAGELSGGRYRPLSIVSFAIEYEFFGASPAVSHAINVLLYLLTGLLIYYLLSRFWFNKNRPLAFLTAFLFLIHPVHTEAVANIKGRDELLAFFLLLLTLITLFRYLHDRKRSSLILSLFFYFLALLSKENSITFLAVIPFSLYFFGSQSLRDSLKQSLPFLLAAGLWFALRYAVIGSSGAAPDDIMNDPFLYAGAAEKSATAFFILLKYLQLLVWPHPLVYDYGYAQIAYRHFSDPAVLLSIVLHAGMLIAAWAGWRRKAVWSFSALYYLATISIVSNLIIPLGGTMGERLLYIPSFAFALFSAWLLQVVYRNLPRKIAPGLALVFLAILTAGSAWQSINRNRIWKNNKSLFIHDVKEAPQSIKANTAAAGAYVNIYLEEQDTAALLKALEYYHRAEALYPVREDSFKRELFLYNNYINQAFIYYSMDSLQQAEKAWHKAKAIKPFHPKVKEYARALALSYYKKANEAAGSDLAQAIRLYQKAVELDPSLADAWYNLGGALYTAGQLTEAGQAFEKALALNPDNEKARQGLAAVDFLLNKKK